MRRWGLFRMKKCKRCGALQDDHHYTCIDCGETLGSSLSKEEEYEEDKKVKEKITKLSNRTDYFYVTKLDKVVAALLFLSFFIYLVLAIINYKVMIKDVLFILYIVHMIWMLFTGLDLLYPWISWEFYKLKLSFSIANTDDIIPTEMSLLFRRAGSYFILVFANSLIIYILTQIL
jgi:hypothetical protein